MRIGHAHLKVRDSQVSAAFYKCVLGITIRERVGRHFIFMSGTEVHQEIALQEVGSGARSPERWDLGLFHVAFEVPDKSALANCYQTLVNLRIPVVMVNQRIS